MIGDDSKTLITPNYNFEGTSLSTRKNIDAYADEFAKLNQIERVKCPFYFEGGNIRCYDDILYIGTDTIIQNIVAKRAKITKQEVIKTKNYIAKWFGMDVIIVGEKTLFKQLNEGITDQFLLKQPLFHLDLFFTPLGDNRFVVGDIKETLELLKTRKFVQITTETNSLIKQKKEELTEFSDITFFENKIKSLLSELSATTSDKPFPDQITQVFKNNWGKTMQFLDEIME